MTTYDALREHALADPEVRAEYERLNREDFALLGTMLAARRVARTTHADSEECTETSTAAVK